MIKQLKFFSGEGRLASYWVNIFQAKYNYLDRMRPLIVEDWRKYAANPPVPEKKSSWTEEEVKKFLRGTVKPEWGDWAGKTISRYLVKLPESEEIINLLESYIREGRIFVTWSLVTPFKEVELYYTWGEKQAPLIGFEPADATEFLKEIESLGIPLRRGHPNFLELGIKKPEIPNLGELMPSIIRSKFFLDHFIKWGRITNVLGFENFDFIFLDELKALLESPRFAGALGAEILSRGLVLKKLWTFQFLRGRL